MSGNKVKTKKGYLILHRDKMPPRPAGQRTEPEPQNGFMPGFGFGEGGGFQFHFGIGAFPFGIFTTFNNWGGGAAVPPGMY